MSPFDEMQGRTFCPFAKKARIRFVNSWDMSRSYEENVRSQGAALRVFVEEQARIQAHGFVSEIYLGEKAKDFASVRSEFAQYLFNLSKYDESCRRCLKENLLSLDWQFEFATMRMFLNVFAPCYDQKHSKSVRSEGFIYIFFQPEGSFDLCGISGSSQTTKNAIRATFAANGSAYGAELIEARIEAAIYMFPVKIGDPPVDWWNYLPKLVP